MMTTDTAIRGGMVGDDGALTIKNNAAPVPPRSELVDDEVTLSPACGQAWHRIAQRFRHDVPPNRPDVSCLPVTAIAGPRPVPLLLSRLP